MNEEVRFYVGGAKIAHGKLRAPYVANPETSRDPPTRSEREAMHGRSGSKLWQKARRGKLGLRR